MSTPGSHLHAIRSQSLAAECILLLVVISMPATGPPLMLYGAALPLVLLVPSVSLAEHARQSLKDETAENDETQNNYKDVSLMQATQRPARPGDGVGRGSSLIQTGEIGLLGASFARFLIWSSDLPLRASCSLTNLALRRRCSSVWACTLAVASKRAKEDVPFFSFPDVNR